MNHAFGLQMMMKAIEGKGEALARIMTDASQIATKLPGCQACIVIKGITDPDLVMITEVWDSQSAHQHSLENHDLMKTINQSRVLIQHLEHHIGRPVDMERRLKAL